MHRLQSTLFKQKSSNLCSCFPGRSPFQVSWGLSSKKLPSLSSSQTTNSSTWITHRLRCEFAWLKHRSTILVGVAISQLAVPLCFSHAQMFAALRLLFARGIGFGFCCQSLYAFSIFCRGVPALVMDENSAPMMVVVR